MAALAKFLHKIQSAQWVLIGAGLLGGIAAFLLGVSDNPPGILLLYISLTCLAGAWVWNLPAP